MSKRILFFSLVFVLIAGLARAKGNTYISFVYGYTPLHLSDFEDHVKSLNTMFNSIYDNFPPVGQEVEKTIGLAGLKRASSFESELRMEIVRRFEIGILFTYYFAQQESRSSVRAGNYEVLAEMTTKLTIINPNLVLFHYIPFSKRFTLELYAGAGYYYAHLPFNQFLSFDHPELFGHINYFYQQAVKANLGSHGLGALAGVTLEIRPVRFLGILLGGRYRTVHMGRLSGSGTFKDTYTPLTEIERGVLYYYYDQDLEQEFGADFPLLIYSEDEPTGLEGLKEARLNLTGWTLIIGLRIWF
ncbi:MAG: hypothetical protein ACE5LC_00355 [Candidatus Aminicenantales bacterium]